MPKAAFGVLPVRRDRHQVERQILELTSRKDDFEEETYLEALETLLDSASPDPAAVGAKAIALHRSKQAMKAAHDTLDAGIVAMLDDTQRVKYQALQDARPEHGRFERFGRGKGHERRR